MSETAEQGNVVAVNGGKVHVRYPMLRDAWPLCRTGAQMRRGTRYTTTDRPVTCAKCAPMDTHDCHPGT